jgi:AraC-like DNA-binding protein
MLKTVIIKPERELVKKYVQYFLFFVKDDKEAIQYTTFPNNNLCLAIYRQSMINYINKPGFNHCVVKSGGTVFSSRLYGFHTMPFTVNVNGWLDQVCILFYPSALRAFTNASYEDLMPAENVFDEIFPKEGNRFLEKLFDQANLNKRATILEQLLLQRINGEIAPKLKEALWLIATNRDEVLNIESLSQKLSISDTTLFRLFKSHLGQNPKSYLKTFRFRQGLNDVLRSKNSLTKVAYLNQYYDQAHFIKEFKAFAGLAPKQLADRVFISQNDLAWIPHSKEVE